MSEPVPQPNDGLPVAPSLSTRAFPGARRAALATPRLAFIALLAVVLALGAGLVAFVLTRLISLVTNLAYFGRASTALVFPADHHLGVRSVMVPVVGGLLVGCMARWGTAAIRGHGIPEAMERVLLEESRIGARVAFWKPVSAAIAIGTGGPFGAEGPIIATGAALGSLVGQLPSIDASERKALLAAGAAAGMSATFGTPVSAVLLVIELLLFEYRARTLIPVVLASATAAAFRGMVIGWSPFFAMPTISKVSPLALLGYVAVGAAIGAAAAAVTRLVYRIEDAFEALPVHWMWWPAVGGAAVGVVGLVEPRTLGVGYDNIEHLVRGDLPLAALLMLAALKLVSWSVALGSGTSGGTLAPLFTIGGAAGAVAGVVLSHAGLPIDVRIAAVVGMAAMFAGASHALMASVVFAYEATGQPATVVPLLAGCAAAYLVSRLLMQSSIMTEKLLRRGLDGETHHAFDLPDAPVR
jgi:H+/Cl- antiporter ClcA